MRQHKFRAKQATRTWSDGSEISFQSRKEARYFDQLQLAERSGELVFFLRQVPFHLPGGVTYRVDFQEFWADGAVRFVDVKGHRTKEFIRNKKMVESLYPIEIIEV